MEILDFFSIYVDAIINHMAVREPFVGTGGSEFNPGSGAPYEESYPAVPYTGDNFNGDNECPTESLNVEDFMDELAVRNCRLYGLRDLQIDQEYVREKLQDYLNDLIQMGVAGFRIDAAKHMWPDELSKVLDGLEDLNQDWFPENTQPYIFQEVVDLDEEEPIRADEYVRLGRVTEFKYSTELAEHVRGENGKSLSGLVDFGDDFLDSSDALVFTDNHDNQRGHVPGEPLTYKDPVNYKVGNAFELAWNYGHVRVMSSFEFEDPDAGPADPVVDCDGDNWVCEHSWPEVRAMVGFHNAVLNEPVENWVDNGNMTIAFSRGNKGFVAINKEDEDWEETFQTGLPAGDYCDVVSCEGGNEAPCSGDNCRGAITVDEDGFATLTVPADRNPFLAIHV